MFASQAFFDLKVIVIEQVLKPPTPHNIDSLMANELSGLFRLL